MSPLNERRIGNAKNYINAVAFNLIKMVWVFGFYFTKKTA